VACLISCQGLEQTRGYGTNESNVSWITALLTDIVSILGTTGPSEPHGAPKKAIAGFFLEAVHSILARESYTDLPLSQISHHFAQIKVGLSCL
jgi:hypothetical protein